MKLNPPTLILLVLATLSGLLMGQGQNSDSAKTDKEKLELLQKELLKQKESYSNLDQLLTSEAFLGEIQIYEGLPHQSWNRELLKAELKKNTSFNSNGFPFYKKKIQPSNADNKALKLLLQSKKCYHKYSGPKFCGGYHPDFMIHFKGKEETITIQLCFGCHEARIYTKDTTIYCDLASNAYTMLQAILEDNFQFRPDKKRHVFQLIKYLNHTDISEKLLSKVSAKKWKFSIYQVIKDGLVEVQFTDDTNTETVLFEWYPKHSQWMIINRKTNGILKPNLPKKAANLKIAINLDH